MHRARRGGAGALDQRGVSGAAKRATTTGTDGYQVDGGSLCEGPGTLYVTTTYTISTLTNDGGVVETKAHYRDTLEFVPYDPTQASYRGTDTEVEAINDTPNVFLGTANFQAMLHGSDGTTLRSFFNAPFVYASAAVRANVLTVRVDDCSAS